MKLECQGRGSLGRGRAQYLCLPVFVSQNSGSGHPQCLFSEAACKLVTIPTIKTSEIPYVS